MDYEKKYNVALGRAKELIALLDKVKLQATQADIYEIFPELLPELRESDGEKIINSLPDEPVSEDLKKEFELQFDSLPQEILDKQSDGGIEFHDKLYAFSSHFANWQKEQMLKEAVEKTVGQLERQWGGNIHFMHGFEVDEMDFPFLNSQGCGYGDRVRIIVLKAEQEKQECEQPASKFYGMI